MILTKLTFHNFGIYAGRHEVELAPIKNRPIILFGGLNGAGKTTLLEGIQFAFFGRSAKFLSRSKSAYLDFLSNSINRRNQHDSASVGIEFSNNNQGRKETFEVVRTWSKRTSGTSNESIQVFKNGELNIELSERWPELSETFFPSQLSDLFFFDGERIETLAMPERCSELIRTGLNSLLGLDIVTNLSRTLSTLDRKIKVANSQDNDKERLIRLNERINLLNEQQLVQTDELRVETERLASLQIQLEILHETLKQQGGELYEKRDNLLQRQVDLIRFISEKRLELVDISSTTLPLTMMEEMFKKIEYSSASSLTGSQKEIVESALQVFSANVLAELTAQGHLSVDNLESVERIMNALKEVSSDHNLKPEISISRGNIHRIIAEGNVLRAQSLKLLMEIGKYQNELEQIEKNMLAIPDATRLEPLFVEMKNIEDEIRLCASKRISLAENLRRVEREIVSADRQFSIAEEGVKSNEAEEILTRKMRNRLLDARDVLANFEIKIRNKHISNLEKLIKEGFVSLIRKRKFVKSISISPENYLLSINIVGEGLVPAIKLSAGERQLLAVAVLWALAKASGIELPTVIDTPLGRLDSEHRRAFVENYFPNAGRQVILLSTDEELVGSYYDAIKKHLSHQYLIEYDEDNQSSNFFTGYFKDEQVLL